MGQGRGLRTCTYDKFQDHALRTRDPEQEGKYQENPFGSVVSVEWKRGRGGSSDSCFRSHVLIAHG